MARMLADPAAIGNMKYRTVCSKNILRDAVEPVRKNIPVRSNKSTASIIALASDNLRDSSICFASMNVFLILIIYFSMLRLINVKKQYEKSGSVDNSFYGCKCH